MGSDVGTKRKYNFSVISSPYTHDAFRVQPENRDKTIYGSFATIDQAIDYWVAQEKLAQGDADMDIPRRDIGICRGEQELKETGEYRVSYFAKKGIQDKTFDNY